MAVDCPSSGSLSHGPPINSWQASFIPPFLFTLWFHVAMLYFSFCSCLGNFTHLQLFEPHVFLDPFPSLGFLRRTVRQGRLEGRATGLCVTPELCQESVLRSGQHTQFLGGGRTLTLLTKFSLLPWSLHSGQKHPFTSPIFPLSSTIAVSMTFQPWWETVRKIPKTLHLKLGRDQKQRVIKLQLLENVSRNKKRKAIQMHITCVTSLTLLHVPASQLFHQVFPGCKKKNQDLHAAAFENATAAAFSHGNGNGVVLFASTQEHSVSHLRFKNPAGPRYIHAPTSGAECRA